MQSYKIYLNTHDGSLHGLFHEYRLIDTGLILPREFYPKISANLCFIYKIVDFWKIFLVQFSTGLLCC
jgi:hypothetical protein